MHQKRRLQILISFVALLFFFGTVNSALAQTEAGYITVDTPQVKEMLGKDPKPLLAFAASPLEFSAERIPRSVCIPSELVPVYYNLPDDLERAIIFYCLGTRCVKSEHAAKAAVKMGYKNVFYYPAGLKGWKEDGNPVSTTMRYEGGAAPSVSPEALNEKLSKGEQVFVIDIRSQDGVDEFGKMAYASFHYPLFRFHVLYLELPKTKTIVLTDIRGVQAPFAGQYLLSKGFQRDKVFWMEGGMSAWKERGLPMADTGEVPSK